MRRQGRDPGRGRGTAPRKAGSHGGALADSDSIVREAARIICNEAVVDYRAAKRKAAERLGLRPGSSLPDNVRIEAAVLDYLRLFGGTEYRHRLQSARRCAVKAMRLLARFEPRLVGSAVTGAMAAAHRVQLHAFADKAEMLDVFLHDRGIPFEMDERDYRYADGSVYQAPLVRFDADGEGIDVAIFPTDAAHRAPLSPVDGRPARRLTLAQAEALAETVPDIAADPEAGPRTDPGSAPGSGPAASPDSDCE
jgi:hypothetical protein